MWDVGVGVWSWFGMGFRDDCGLPTGVCKGCCRSGGVVFEKWVSGFWV